jgi:hypothetical protein
VDEQVSFSVVAEGSGTLAYQWRKGGVAIPNANAAMHAIASASLTDAGSYDVVVSNAVGSVTSRTAALVVSAPPTIVTQPVGRTLNPGAALSLSVTATGTAPLTYQWSKDGQADRWGDRQRLTRSQSVQVGSAGEYTVAVSNAVGTATSQPVTVSVNAGVKITTQPASLSVNPGASATFSVSASGASPLTYQWRKAGVNIPGANSSTYTIDAASISSVASYDVAVTNPVGTVLSAVANLALNQAVAITTQPVGRLLVAGSALELNVVATGTDPKTYQWSRNGVAISGGTAATYRIATAQPADSGTYTVAVSNVVNSVTSAAAVVEVLQGVTITAQPAPLTLNPGTLAVFSVTATGGGTLTYQWRKNGTNIAGGTLATYRIAAVQTTDAGTYTVVVGNQIGSVTSAPAQLALNAPVAITTQPLGATISTGTSHTLRVVATGTAPISYQWMKGGVNIAGATAASYTLGAAGSADSGAYSVKVSNMVNEVTSIAVNLVVGELPTITSQPAALTLNPGTLAVFSVTATGGGTLTYQWRKNGTNIAGGTLATYRIAAVQTTDAGTYTVVVGNQIGSVTSAPAQLALNAPVAITTQPLGATISAGTSHTFRVVATGTAPISYQWMKGGVNIPGATAATYTLDAPGSADGGAYSVKVSNMVNTVTSAAANLVVAGPPAITAQPVALKIVAGATGTLSAKVRSTLQFTYQWKKDGTAIAAGTLYTGQAGTVAASAAETTLNLGLVNASDLTPGSYSLTVTSALGSVSSADAAVTVQFSKPKFLEATLVKAARTIDLRSFADQTGPTLNALVPANETLRVNVMGDGTVTYAWRYTTIKASTTQISLTDQTGPSLDFSQSSVNKGPGIYFCKATVGAVSTELRFIIPSFAAAVAGSQVAALGAPLQIVSEPVSVSANAGGVVQLGVGVTAGKRSYFWFREGADGRSVLVGTGGTGFLRLDPLRASDSGRYFVVITDAEGNSVTSRPAQVTVLTSAD